MVRCTGETVRRLETRLKEHQKACRVGTEAMSAVAEHICMHKHQHPIKWEETIILDQARGHRELLEISKPTNSEHQLILITNEYGLCTMV